MIDLSEFSSDLRGEYDFFSFTFSDGENDTSFNLADLTVTAVHGDATYTGYSDIQDGTTTLYFGNPDSSAAVCSAMKTNMLLNVPEPQRRRLACCPWRSLLSAAAGIELVFFLVFSFMCL